MRSYSVLAVKAATRGDLIRHYRELRGLTQTELAAVTTMDQGSVSEIELGRREAGAELMARFVNVLDIPGSEVAAAYAYEVSQQQHSDARKMVVMNPPKRKR